MKFWQKAYILILLLFIVVFDIGGYALIKKSYQINEQSNTSAGIMSYNAAARDFQLNYTEYRKYTTGDITMFLDSFVKNYASNDVYFEVHQGEKRLYSNFFSFQDQRNELLGNTINTAYRKINGTLYLFVSGNVADFRLVTIYKSDALSEYSAQMQRYFVFLCSSVSVLLSIALIFLLKGLTRPLVRLNKAVEKIADGQYENRAEVSSRDEIGDFARNFNKMADAIETHIGLLSQSNEQKERFVNNLTHELRTPLATIKGYSELLLTAKCSKTEKEQAYYYIREHTDRLINLTQKLMDLLYFNTITSPLARIDVQRLFDEIIDLEKDQLAGKAINLRTEINTPNIFGDYALLQTAVINLIENAVGASKFGSEIKLVCYGNVIEVSDNGTGIPQPEIDKITEEFYCVDKSRSRNSGGVGLGLAIVKQIMESHGGKLEITSQVGLGTTIKLVF